MIQPIELGGSVFKRLYFYFSHFKQKKVKKYIYTLEKKGKLVIMTTKESITRGWVPYPLSFSLSPENINQNTKIK